MATLEDMRNTCISQRKEILAAADNMKKAADYSRKDGGKSAANGAVKAKENYGTVVNNARNKINSVYNDVIASINAAYAPNGADITADAELLRDGLPLILSEDELKTLAQKYRANNTMLRLIAGYAKKNYPALNIHIETKEHALDMANRIRQYCNSALVDKVIYDYAIVSEAGWTKISSTGIR